MWTLPFCGCFHVMKSHVGVMHNWLAPQRHIYTAQGKSQSPIQLHFFKLLQYERGRGKRLETLSQDLCFFSRGPTFLSLLMPSECQVQIVHNFPILDHLWHITVTFRVSQAIPSKTSGSNHVSLALNGTL